MARARRDAGSTRARRATPAARSKRFTESPDRLLSPMLDWSSGSAPERFYLPSISELRSLGIDELAVILERFGINGGWPALKASAAGYVQRMSMIPPGSPAFIDEINRLTETVSKRGSLGMSRTAYRDLQLFEALDGDTNVEMIWIAEQDDSTCNRCAARGGDIDTFKSHAAKGLPGPAVCEGGSYCRCQLVRID